MSYNVSSISNYVEQNKSALVGKAVMAAQTLKHIDTQVGVKGATALNNLTTNFSFKDGRACGFNPEGNAEISQRILNPKVMAVQMQFCPKDLIDTYLNEEVRIAATGSDMPAEEAVVGHILKSVKAKLETALWKGDEGTGMQGFKTIDTTGKVVVNYSDKTTAYDKILAVYMAMPTEILNGEEEVGIFVGADMYRQYIQDLIKANMFHHDAHEGIGEIYIPGTNVKIICANGLNGTGEVWGSFLSNFVYGTDMTGDEEIFDLWYSNDDRVWKLDIEFNASVQVRFPDLLVVGNNG